MTRDPDCIFCKILAGEIPTHVIWEDEKHAAFLDIFPLRHGQAIVIHSPVGTLLFDAGSQYNRNVGQRVITPFLRCNGISRLDAAVISHDDIDHINGIVEVVKKLF